MTQIAAVCAAFFRARAFAWADFFLAGGFTGGREAGITGFMGGGVVSAARGGGVVSGAGGGEGVASRVASRAQGRGVASRARGGVVWGGGTGTG
jgi:hypothetical protein